MKCPICNTWFDLLETRKREGKVYRRYECANLHRFTTEDDAVTRADSAKRPPGRPRKPTHTLNSTQTVAVATDVYWMPIDAATPRNVKLQLLTIGGVAQYGPLGSDTSFYTHWCPLPKKRDEHV